MSAPPLSSSDTPAAKPPYRVRLSTRADATKLAALSIQVWLDTYATRGIDQVIAQYVLEQFTVRRFEAIIGDGNSQLLVAEIKQHLIGYSLIKFGAICPATAPSDVELETLYVLNRFARRGAGSALLARSEQLVRLRTGSAKLWVAVNAQNESAIAFYRKQNLRHVGKTNFVLGKQKHENIVFLNEHE